MTQSDNSDIDISINNDTITIKLDETYGATTSYLDNTDVTYTTDNFSGDTITLDLSNLDDTITLDASENIIDKPFWQFDLTPFVDTMPTVEEINRMCEIYPGLAKAYKNFKTAYKLVEQDYEGKKKAGEIDDGIPF